MDARVRTRLDMKRINSSSKIYKEFGILIAILFPLIIGFLLPFITGHSFRLWTFWIGIPSLILAFSAPNYLKIPYDLWISIGNTLGWVNSRIILGLIFILVLFPISILLNLFKYDPLKRKITNAKTYREVREEKDYNLTRIF